MTEIEKLAATFAMEFMTGHHRPLRDDAEYRCFEQLKVVMLAFAAQVTRLTATSQSPQDGRLRALAEKWKAQNAHNHKEQAEATNRDEQRLAATLGHRIDVRTRCIDELDDCLAVLDAGPYASKGTSNE